MLRATGFEEPRVKIRRIIDPREEHGGLGRIRLAGSLWMNEGRLPKKELRRNK